jgi:hypothetical protein
VLTSTPDRWFPAAGWDAPAGAAGELTLDDRPEVAAECGQRRVRVAAAPDQRVRVNRRRIADGNAPQIATYRLEHTELPRHRHAPQPEPELAQSLATASRPTRP